MLNPRGIILPALASGSSVLAEVGANSDAITVGLSQAPDEGGDRLRERFPRKTDHHECLSFDACRLAGSYTGIELDHRVVALVLATPYLFRDPVDSESEHPEPVVVQALQNVRITPQRECREVRRCQSASSELDAVTSGRLVNSTKGLIEFRPTLERVQVGEINGHGGMTDLREECGDELDLFQKPVQVTVFLSFVLRGCTEIAVVDAAVGDEQAEFLPQIVTKRLFTEQAEHRDHRGLELGRKAHEREPERRTQIIITAYLLNIAEVVEDLGELVRSDPYDPFTTDQDGLVVPFGTKACDDVAYLRDVGRPEDRNADEVARSELRACWKAEQVSPVEIDEIRNEANLHEPGSQIQKRTREVDLGRPVRVRRLDEDDPSYRSLCHETAISFDLGVPVPPFMQFFKIISIARALISKIEHSLISYVYAKEL